MTLIRRVAEWLFFFLREVTAPQGLHPADDLFFFVLRSPWTKLLSEIEECLNSDWLIYTPGYIDCVIISIVIFKL